MRYRGFRSNPAVIGLGCFMEGGACPPPGAPPHAPDLPPAHALETAQRSKGEAETAKAAERNHARP